MTSDRIGEALKRTTQLAKTTYHFLMRRHIQSLFKQLQRPRLNEVVATDTYLSSVKSIEGYSCSQVFYGFSSGTIDVVGMKTESKFPSAYKDFS